MCQEKHSHQKYESPRYMGARRRTHSNGYVQEHCPEHPSCNRFGYVLLHRLVMEDHIQRYLTGREVVHHEDEDPQNNSIENLRLFPDQAAHMRHHQRDKAKYLDPEVIQLVREAAASSEVRVADLPVANTTVLRICAEHGIEWKKARSPQLTDDEVREALRGRTTKEAARYLGVGKMTLYRRFDHLLTKRKSPTRRKKEEPRGQEDAPEQTGSRSRQS